MPRTLVASLLLVISAACTGDEPVTPEPVPSFCEQMEWTGRPLLTEAAFGANRRSVAADFVVPTTQGDWTFSEHFTGCETYMFVPDTLVVSPLDDTPLMQVQADLRSLIENSPLNTHWFFLTMGEGSEAVTAFTADMDDRLERVLGRYDVAGQDWWRERVHVVSKSGTKPMGWIGEAMTSTGQGFGIDRFQRIRGFGGLADVTRFSSALDNAGAWPWEANLAYLDHEVRYFNYESDREDELAQDAWTDIWLFHEEENAGNGVSHATAQLPDAETMAGFDTMLIDLTNACDPSGPEMGNCDAWDAVDGVSICQADDPDVCDTELARYITTYHREGRWLVDASHLLPFLAGGGERRFQLWGTRHGHFNSLRIRLTNRNKGGVPAEATHLWDGGAHNADYAANHPPVDVAIPADATKVYLYMVLSGHGQGGDDNCAEFCDHQHTFTFSNGDSVTASHPLMGDQHGCLNQIERGTVPNQNGTWWFERSSWCPGKQVDPWVWDVTEFVTPGSTETIGYTTNYGDAVDDGNIFMHSWLVSWN